MENIELFDRYIDGSLTKEERIEFDARLKSDEQFAAEFKLYTATVIGVCKEAEQDNTDFGIAMKHLSKDELRQIIGSRKEMTTPKKKESKPIFFKPIFWHITSAAAMVAIVVTSYFTFQQQATYNVDNAIAMMYVADYNLSRSATQDEMDITALSDDELKAKLPELTDAYKSAEDDLEIANNGYQLAMTYLRLHDRVQARNVLKEIVTKYRDNEDLEPEVRKCESVLKLIK